MTNIYKKLEQTMAKNRFISYIHPPYELEYRLVQSIKQTDFDKSTEILKQINSLERAELSKRPLSSLKYSLVGSCTLFTRAVIEAGLDPETAFMLSDYYINLVDETADRIEVQALEYKMLDDFIKVLKKNKEYKEYIYNSIINAVIRYVIKNIERNMSLQEISSVVHVHPNYLSSVFKKEVGKTLSEYINERKITAIKQYMSNTDLSLSEISDTFNFSHVSYFSRFFKKHTGLTPTDFRKQCSQTNG